MAATSAASHSQHLLRRMNLPPQGRYPPLALRFLTSASDAIRFRICAVEESTDPLTQGSTALLTSQAGLLLGNALCGHQRGASCIAVGKSPSHNSYWIRVRPQCPEFQRRQLDRESQPLHFAVSSAYRSCDLEFGDEPKARLGRKTKSAGFGLRTRS